VLLQCIEVQDVGSHYLLCEIFEFFVHWDKQVVVIVINSHFVFAFLIVQLNICGHCCRMHSVFIWLV